MRESDDECFRRVLKSRDILAPIASGAWDKHHLVATLEDWCRGRHFYRTSADDITIYKAVGTALEDLAAASLAYDAAVAEQA
ncbi:ornithine cyclodeaminase/alanine dehydrogenase-like protein (mu-crystallin family) [Variovorax paradoxus]|nr:ornithine cyclodeaminase/alanine dehydrogenase-like protein (mu-crystallin family) [Variovorax paradoxus]